MGYEGRHLEPWLRRKFNIAICSLLEDQLVCEIWEIFERRRLFSGRVKAEDSFSFEGHLSSMVHQLGPPPQQFMELKAGKHFFDESGMFNPPQSFFGRYLISIDFAGEVRGVPSWKSEKVPHFWDWEENLKGEEQAEFFDFMRAMLQWLPQDRLSTKQLLEHKWLQAKAK